ncbi:MAG TPA: hypothetical protein VGQ57_08060 [Polyangiaceae bacterium]|nr:hypothetical protein [Polyangiaceae bacterium]
MHRGAVGSGPADWSHGALVPARLEALTDPERAALATHFSEMGLVEHASIAAFARFSLELVALGASAALVQDAALAMLDEIRHAELAFALASAYAGRALGPGPLSGDGAVTNADLESVLRTVLLEGCIGEATAAAEAQALARTTEDETVRQALEGIAGDEARHAALAYRFVAWALARDPGRAARVVRSVLAAELDKSGVRHRAPNPDEAANTAALKLGIATDDFRQALRAEAIEQVAVPCLEALLASQRGRVAA